MKKNIFAPKDYQVLEAVRPQIEKLTKMRRKLVYAEMFFLTVMISAIYFLIF